MESFASLGLSEAIVRAVAEKGYTEPTPIQLQAIPAILARCDLMAGAQTGTGKTAGFALPILQLLSSAPPVNSGAKVRTLVLTPTRELAAQVEESFRHYGAHLPLSSMTLFGGVGIHPQIDRLRKPVDIVVATPGRLLDHVGQGTIDLSEVEILVLDEADRMLDMGFIRDIRKIIALLPAGRQNLMFSATFSEEIRGLADGLLRNPSLIQASPVNAMAEAVNQRAYAVDRERKRELLAHLITTQDWIQVLVFTRTKHGANRLAQQLVTGGIPALAIHGNKSQSARTRALSEFKSGTLRVLVATDIAARGIDIKELPHVVNYDLPNVPEDYVHRIGRTGRAGSDGEAVSLVCVDDAMLLRDIERFTDNTLSLETLPGFEPDPNARAEPIKGVRGGGRVAPGGAPRPAPRAARRPPQPSRDAAATAPGVDGAEGSEGATDAGTGTGTGTGNDAGALRTGRSSRRRRGQRGRGAAADGAPRVDAQGQAVPERAPRVDAQGQALPERGPRPPAQGQQARKTPRSNNNQRGNVPPREPQPHRSRYENGGQPLDNANRSPTALASGRSDRPGNGSYGGGGGGGRMRRGAAPMVTFDPNHPPAPSEIVAILQGKRPTTVDGIPEEDRLALALANRGNGGPGRSGGNGGGGNGGGANPGGNRQGKNGRSRSARPGGQGNGGQGNNGGNSRAGAERPLHERFPGLPRDED
jgi:ATP-dependent RNA helicase RhlE